MLKHFALAPNTVLNIPRREAYRALLSKAQQAFNAMGLGLLLFALLLFALLFITTPARAYPDKPIRVIVPQAAGSSFDSVVRLVCLKLTQYWNKTLIIDNRPGANGIIGLEAGAKANPDGYTITTGAISHLSINPSVYKTLPYQTLEDFDALSQLSAITFLLVVNPTLKANSVSQFIALAQARPQSLRYASSGTGNMNHLGVELFASAVGAKLLHLPYKGETPAVMGLIGGESDMMITTMPIAVPYIENGRLRALAVASSTRTQRLPQLPTLVESGVAGVEITGWIGALVPHGTPSAITQTLYEGIHRALQEPDIKERLISTGADPVGSTPQAFKHFLHAETQKWARVIKTAGLSLSQ